MSIPTKRAFGRLLSHRNVPVDNASTVEDNCHEKAKKARLQQQEPENIQRLTLRLNEAVLPFKKQTTCALEAIENFRDVDKENVVEIADENALVDYTAGQVDERVSMPHTPPAKTPTPPPPAVPQQGHSVATRDHVAEAPKGVAGILNVNAVVEVCLRPGKGKPKPFGAAFIKAYHADTDTYDVKYVLDGRKEKGLKRELMTPVDLREDTKEVPRPRRVPESTKAVPIRSMKVVSIFEGGEDQDIERPIVGQRVKWKDQDLAGKITNVRRFTGFSGVACWQVKIEVTATGKVYETIWPDDDVFIVKSPAPIKKKPIKQEPTMVAVKEEKKAASKLLISPAQKNRKPGKPKEISSGTNNPPPTLSLSPVLTSPLEMAKTTFKTIGSSRRSGGGGSSITIIKKERMSCSPSQPQRTSEPGRRGRSSSTTTTTAITATSIFTTIVNRKTHSTGGSSISPTTLVDQKKRGSMPVRPMTTVLYTLAPPPSLPPPTLQHFVQISQVLSPIPDARMSCPLCHKEMKRATHLQDHMLTCTYKQFQISNNHPPLVVVKEWPPSINRTMYINASVGNPDFLCGDLIQWVSVKGCMPPLSTYDKVISTLEATSVPAKQRWMYELLTNIQTSLSPSKFSNTWMPISCVRLEKVLQQLLIVQDDLGFLKSQVLVLAHLVRMFQEEEMEASSPSTTNLSHILFHTYKDEKAFGMRVLTLLHFILFKYAPCTHQPSQAFTRNAVPIKHEHPLAALHMAEDPKVLS